MDERKAFEAWLKAAPDWAPEFEQHRAWVEQYAFMAWRAATLAERERNQDAKRYCWLAENAIIETDAFRHDGKDPASTKRPLDMAIDAAIRKG